MALTSASERDYPVDLSAAQRAYDQARDAQRNVYRLFHACARAVFEGIDGDDTTAGNALLAHAPFPDRDARLVAASKKVLPAQRKYTARLAAAGFAKAEQEHFVETLATLEQAAATLRKDKTSRSSAVQARADAIAKLRRCIKFLCEAGKRAFRDAPEARDFAPVTRAQKPKAKAGPAPVVLPAHAAANGAAAE